MSREQIILLVAAAIVVAWMVGAYNRLLGLRAAVAGAWKQVDEALQQRGDAIAPLVSALRTPLSGEHRALDALLAAQLQVQAAAAAMRARPVAASLAAALIGAEAAMASASSRVLALLDQQDGLRRDESVAPYASVLGESVGRLTFARQLFNDAAQAYNDALHQVPTRLLSRFFGFQAAGRI
ncbi:MAG: LemA family protein [Burkholderiales bacterium]|nr:LemA family protein [Burkholderiales bacterium]MDE2397601.1 LemA family protein [Burkholderiales bacterium]